jgi:hypothetical protein
MIDSGKDLRAAARKSAARFAAEARRGLAAGGRRAEQYAVPAPLTPKASPPS